jgi:hypothetical protein
VEEGMKDMEIEKRKRQERPRKRGEEEGKRDQEIVRRK